MKGPDLSANEIEALVLKAARGGGCPVGLAEDLAIAAAYVDLNILNECPCHSGAVAQVPAALDRALAHGDPQMVRADPALVAGYVAAWNAVGTQAVVMREHEDGALLEVADDTPPEVYPALGRRHLRPDLLTHLRDMAAKILVPETEHSRAAGAGAGLTDND